MTLNDHEAGKVSDLTRPILGIENRTAHEVFSIMCDRITHRAESQTGAVAGDYFGNLVARAHTAAAKASIKFPQPNYIALKIAEEAGEVVRGAVHYAEGRMEWSEVEGEIVQLLAMLIRFVTEGDQVIGVSPPSALEPAPIKETASPAVAADVQVVTYEAIRWTDRNSQHYRMDHGAILNDHSTGAWVRYADYQRLAAENERLREAAEAATADYSALSSEFEGSEEEAAAIETRMIDAEARAEAAESKLAEAVKVLALYADHNGYFSSDGEPYEPNDDHPGRAAEAFLASLTRAEGDA